MDFSIIFVKGMALEKQKYMISAKKIPLKFILLFGILLFAFTLHAQIQNEILTSLNTGNAKTLSKYFDQNVQLTVLDNDNVYSKAQAQQIISNFFSSNPPNPKKEFELLHESPGKVGAKSIIGVLETLKGEYFRVTIYVKQSEGNNYIHFLRIEKTVKPQ